MKWIITLLTFVFSLPASAQTIYLVIKSRGGGDSHSVSLVSIPMSSVEQCEEEGALITASNRFDLRHASLDTFECIRGK